MNNRFFFIVGAPKAGTTSLHAYLKNHPSIFISNKQKELHFFSQPGVLNTYYETKNFISSIDEYNNLFKKAKDGQICSDISPSYLFNIGTANRIKEFNSKSKIVIILRNPVERAISHYLMDKKIGLVEEPLKEIILNPNKYELYFKEYINMGIYVEQILDYYNNFPIDQIKIIIYEDFFKDLNKNLSSIFDFLDIENIDIDTSEKHNTYVELRFNYHYFFRKFNFLKKISKYIPKNIKTISKRLINKKAIKPLFIEEKVYMYENYFLQDIDKLEKLLNIDLTHWKHIEQKFSL